MYVRSIPMDGAAPSVSAGTTVRVTIDAVASIDETRHFLVGRRLDWRLQAELILKLDDARRTFKKGHTSEGRHIIEEFLEIVRRNSRNIPDDVIRAIVSQEKDLLDCTRDM